MREHARRSTDRGLLEEAIARQMAKMCRAIGYQAPVVAHEVDFKYLVRIDPVDEESQTRGRALVSRAFLIGKGGSIVSFNVEYPDTEDWSDLYVVNREASAVFGPRVLAPLIHLAAERVFFERFGIRTTERMRQDADVDWAVVNAFRSELAAAGHYGSPFRPLAPLPDVLENPGTITRIEKVVEKFKQYQGPGLEGRAGASDVTSLLLREFLKQVPTENLIRAMLTVLEGVMFVGRPAFAEAVKKGLDSLDVDPRLTVYSVLGDPDESSGAVTYLVKDVLASRGIAVARIDRTATSSRNTLVLVDDFVGYGARSSGVIASWLGLVEGATPLSRAGQDWLRSTRVVMIFAAGLPGAAGQSHKVAREYRCPGSGHRGERADPNS